MAGTAKRIAGTVVFAALSVALSYFFRYELGAPNYGLGIVIGITVTCYFFGIIAAAAGFALAIASVYLLSIEAVGPSSTPRLLAIILTVSVACSLVVMLQNARRSVSRRNGELRQAQERLAEALRYERNIAGTLQRAFLPVVPERFGAVSIAAFYEAGSEEAQIGGDFYDVLKLSDSELLIALGDVSGKGIDAARHAAAARYGLRSCIMESKAPAEALRRLNAILLLDPQFDGFATLFVGILDITAGRITYSSGGHEPPIVYRRLSGQHKELRTAGTLVGALPDAGFAEDQISLEQGDVVLLYTDGLSEARDAGEMLGTDGLARILSDTACEDAAECLGLITVAARDYGGGRFRDDAAALLLSI